MNEAILENNTRIQDKYARDKDGNVVSFTDKEACRLCFERAYYNILHQLDDNTYDRIYHGFRKVVNIKHIPSINKLEDLTENNDDLTIKHSIIII